MTDPQLPPPPPGFAPPSPAGAPATTYPGGAPAYPGTTPAYQTPPGAYAAPVGGYAAPAPAAREPKKSTLGLISLLLAAVAAVVTPIIVGVAAFQIGVELPTAAQNITAATSDLAFLSPVRDQVLLAELAFWGGTLSGITAIVLGIMAIVKRAGRGMGVTGLIVSIVAPVLFFSALFVMLGVGAAAGV